MKKLQAFIQKTFSWSFILIRAFFAILLLVISLPIMTVMLIIPVMLIIQNPYCKKKKIETMSFPKNTCQSKIQQIKLIL